MIGRQPSGHPQAHGHTHTHTDPGRTRQTDTRRVNRVRACMPTQGRLKADVHRTPHQRRPSSQGERKKLNRATQPSPSFSASPHKSGEERGGQLVEEPGRKEGGGGEVGGGRSTSSQHSLKEGRKEAQIQAGSLMCAPRQRGHTVVPLVPRAAPAPSQLGMLHLLPFVLSRSAVPPIHGRRVCLPIKRLEGVCAASKQKRPRREHAAHPGRRQTTAPRRRGTADPPRCWRGV